MTITTVNPFNDERIREYPEGKLEEVREVINDVRREQKGWKKSTDERISYFKEVLKPNLERNERDIANQMTMEMGKPISQSIAEVRKCIRLVDYAIDNFERFLQPEEVKTEAMKSYVRFDPLGVVMLIMPWNYPIWQVLRAAVPAMAAGNGVILKHASIVTGSSLVIEEAMDTPLFKSIVVSGSNSLEVLKYVDGVSFTGSTQVGAAIAGAAGGELKKAVLELGGSDPFIVLKSADLEKTAKRAAFARLQNAGQSCIASKRFIIHEEVFEEFHKKLREEFSSVIVGDPREESTFLGPLSSKQQASIIKNQIGQMKSLGMVESFGEFRGNFAPPTIATTDRPYNDEIFGPVAVLKKFRTNVEAIELANETPFGLGASIWGEPSEAEEMIPDIEAGVIFVNKTVSSDPRMPFGGVKKSGLGRELSRYGLIEFTNIKTAWIQKEP